MTRARHRLQIWTQSRLLLIALAAVAVLFIVGGSVWAQLGQQAAQEQTGVVEQQRDAATDQRDATAAQAQSLAAQIRAACTSGDLGGPVCEQAAAVAETPVPPVTPIPGAIGEPGRPPTAEEIQAAVDVYLVANPPPAGRPPNAAEVAAAVASFLTANPPTPGRAPTAEEISAAVEQYFAANPPPAGQDGRNGRDGQDGRAPTAEEIRTAVDDYLAANPPPTGPAGPPGKDGEIGCPNGTSLEPVEFASGETGLGCVDDEQPPETTEPSVTTTQVPGDNTDPDGDNPPENP